MPHSLHTVAQTAFAGLLEHGELSLVDEGGEFHIIADDWTLVLAGDPPTNAMIALDDEDGDPGVLLDNAINQEELAGLRALNAGTDGQVSTLLAASPDPLAQALSGLLRT